MDEQKPNPILPQIRHASIGAQPARLIIDGRHDAAVEPDGRVLVSVCRDVPDEAADWGCGCQEKTHIPPPAVRTQ